jgi:curved DNA-binding protein CbpA
MNDRLPTLSERDLSHYERLGVSAQASPASLRQAFRLRSKALHPDTTTLPVAEAAKNFQQLKESYEFLADPERRRQYDEQLRQRLQPQRPPAPQATDTVDQWDGIGERRPLSGGEWTALLLLGLALLLSLVVGLGVAGVQGRAWQVSPDWLSDVSSAPIERPAESAFHQGAGRLAHQPQR